MNMKKRLLFVDDEERFFQSMGRMLHPQRNVWDLFFAANVDDALAQLHAHAMDMVIADVNMPGRDGFALLSAIRTDPELRDIPVIMVTGSQEYTLKRRAISLGATDLLNKPVCVEDLLARIQNGLRQKAHQDYLKMRNRALEADVLARTHALEQSHIDILWRMAKVGECRDKGTGNHVMRVARYSRAIAQNLGLDEQTTRMIFLTSPLHDIGKIGIPDGILLKPGLLTSEEREEMKHHCEIGAQLLLGRDGMPNLLNVLPEEALLFENPGDENPFLKMAATVALGHHERWDGRGYPQGLAGRAIPLPARIVALADVYDALCSTRPYKPAYTRARAIEIISGEKGRHFDPAVFCAFEEFFAETQKASSPPDTVLGFDDEAPQAVGATR